MLKCPLFYPLFYVVATLFMGCSDLQQPYASIQGSMLGTTYHIKAQLNNKEVTQLKQQVEELDYRMKGEMSIFNPTSQISLINRGESDSLTPWLAENIRLADSVSRVSGGIYDITVAPLVRAWGFGDGARVERPNIDSLLEFVGYNGLSIVDDHLVKSDPRMQIDLNSIAKGFTVDRLADIIESMGCYNYMVDIGGELRLSGMNPTGGAWRVGVERPFDGNMSNGEYIERRLTIEPNSELCAIATSGNYRRFYLNNKGEKVVHTINPITGDAQPSSLLSVTVLASSCALADAYATMFMAAGDKEAEKLAQQITNCEVYFIYNNARAREDEPEHREYFSEEMRKRLMK